MCMCVCIWMACEGCLLMAFSVMKLIGIDFVIVLIFYSFNNVFVSSWVCRIFMGIVWIAWWLSQRRLYIIPHLCVMICPFQLMITQLLLPLTFALFTYATSQISHHLHPFMDAFLMYWFQPSASSLVLQPSLLPSSDIPVIPKAHPQGQTTIHPTLTILYAGSNIWGQGSMQVRTFIASIIYTLNLLLHQPPILMFHVLINI